MKNIQPEMDVEKQVRKACNAIDSALPNVEKASYLAGLASMMLVSVAEGQPQPWSNFAPMADEEFSDA